MGKKGSLSIPDRWLNYDAVGRDIEGTRFVPFKTPLKAEIFEANRSLHPDNYWDIRTLISYAREAGKRIGLVIDLTFTDRYYEATEWNDYNIEFVKIRCAGKEVRFLEKHVREFNRIVDDYCARNPDDSLIGVHCTHGLNRTGYYICRYLIERENWTADEAINQFEYNRGHPMEHSTFKESLFNVWKAKNMVCPEHRNDPNSCWALITCPYSDSTEQHHVDAKHFPEHLRNCRRDYCSKNASSIKFVRCKLDSRHHVPEVEITFHEQICDDYLYRHIVSATSKQPNPLPDNNVASDSSSTDSSSYSDESSENDSDDDDESNEVTPAPAKQSDVEEISSCSNTNYCHEKEIV